MPKFLLKFNAAVIKEIPIDKTPMSIGRKPENDIVIDNMAVSSNHARIVMQGNSYVLEDLKSTNGTFLNEKKIVSSALKNNDQILLGQHTLVFIQPEAEVPVTPAAPKPPVDSEATVVMAPQRQQEILKHELETKAAGAMVGGKQQEPAACSLKVIEGKADQPEYQLTALLTYIGKSDTAAIKIKGLFAPDIAALISKRPTGFIMTAVKEGYPKVNGKPLVGQYELKDGDLIEVGGIKFLFQQKI